MFPVFLGGWDIDKILLVAKVFSFFNKVVAVEEKNNDPFFLLLLRKKRKKKLNDNFPVLKADIPLHFF